MLNLYWTPPPQGKDITRDEYLKYEYKCKFKVDDIFLYDNMQIDKVDSDAINQKQVEASLAAKTQYFKGKVSVRSERNDFFRQLENAELSSDLPKPAHPRAFCFFTRGDLCISV